MSVPLSPQLEDCTADSSVLCQVTEAHVDLSGKLVITGAAVAF